MKVPCSLYIVFCLLMNFFNSNAQTDFSKYPQTQISNDKVTMKLYLPDPEEGYYRATRFDWSGIIFSFQYKGHEYFGEWKKTHDPLVFEDLTGPSESYIAPGPGYEEASPGEGFIRIGIGVLEKQDEEEYVWLKTYPILDYGEWEVKKGKDWIEFIHTLSYRDYGYTYTKRIELKSNEPGFRIIHHLANNGSKKIETDQYNHNFFVIDGEPSGPPLVTSFPYSISTEDDLKGLMTVEDNRLIFVENLDDRSVWMELQGYSDDPADHQFTVVNTRTGAGIRLVMDQPLHRMVFWACGTTISPENFIYISVPPGKTQSWTADYTLFEE